MLPESYREVPVEGILWLSTVAGGGGYNSQHLCLGVYHIWVDGSGRLRIKSSAPAADTDGTIVGSQS